MIKQQNPAFAQQTNQVVQQQQQQPATIVNVPMVPQQQQQNYSYVQQPQQQQTGVPIWDGQIEWQEKDRNNPNSANKMTHTVKARMISFTVLDQSTGQYVPEVPPALAQTWPQKLPLQLLNKQILDILSAQCPPPTKNLLLHTSDTNNQELKNSLSIGVCVFQSTI
jgi:hypothetical protein